MPTRREVLRALDRLEGPIARAFAEAVRQIRSRARLNALVEAIEAQDIERAFRAAGIREGSWSVMTEQIRTAYLEGGQLYASDAPAQLGFQFDLNNARAQEWLRQNSSQLVTLINTDQREAIRETMEAGTRAGRNPRRTALDIVGRMASTGRRQGGIVGLTSQQAGFVRNAREQLLSGDPAVMREYFDRTRRDRRFDGIVRRAIDEGRPVSVADVDRITGRYSDRLLQTRGEAIARTEALSALNEAADQSLRQAVEEGLVREDQVRRVWEASLDGNTRDTHASMNGTVARLNEPFTSPAGYQLMHPGDTSLGAPASEVINCRCRIREDVDWITE